VDKVSLLEFVLFEYPLFEKTFVKKIKFLPIGSIYKVCLNRMILKKINNFKYKFNINLDLSWIDKLEHIIDKVILRIKKINLPDATYDLGLRDGMDSRLVAYFALEHKNTIFR